MHRAIKTISRARLLAQTEADIAYEVAPISATALREEAIELTSILKPLQWQDGDPTYPGYWWVKTKGLSPVVVFVDAKLWHVYYTIGDRANPFQCAGPIPCPV